MQAVILAAGRGRRLGERSEQTPKCLLQLGGRTLVEHQLHTLSEAGVAPVCMVVGFCADEIREVVGIRAEYIENPRWSTTNSIYSFHLAREWVTGPVIVLNSDSVIHPEILNRLLDQDGDAVAYDSSSGNAREHMKVKVVGGRLVDVSKTLPSDDVAGENIGLLKFTPEGARELFEIAAKLVDHGHAQAWLGSALQELVKNRHVSAVDVAGIPWGEIDSCYDLDAVRKNVLPHLEPRAQQRRRAAHLARRAGVIGLLALVGSLAFQTWSVPPRVAWENVSMDGAPRVSIAADGRKQEWWLLNGGSWARTRVAGPETVRIDSRLVLPDDATGELPYVIEVNIDGKRVEWFGEQTVPSGTWRYSERPVGRRRGSRVDVPEGNHEVEVRLVASDSGKCLVRLRQLTAEEED